MGNADFSARMTRVPDEELVRIAFSEPEDGFVFEAVSAAKEELERRKITHSDLDYLKEQIQISDHEMVDRKSAPLSNGAFFAFLIFGPLLTFSLGAAIILLFCGYHKKAMEGFRAILFSFAIWSLFSLAVFLFAG